MGFVARSGKCVKCSEPKKKQPKKFTEEEWSIRADEDETWDRLTEGGYGSG